MIVSVNRAQKGEMEKMEICDSICERAQKDEVEKMEICGSICEQSTERLDGENGGL